MPERVGLHRLIERLTDSAMGERCCYDRDRYDHQPFVPKNESEKPGYRIKKLSADERETLSKAKAKDFNWRGFK